MGFIGGGRVARILLGGLARAGALPPRVVVSDRNPAALEKIEAAFPSVETVVGASRMAAGQDVVFLAVGAGSMDVVLEEIRHALMPTSLLVSLAPACRMARISDALDGYGRIARSIPNAPSIVNRGYNPVSFSAHLDRKDRHDLLYLFRVWGACPEVPEETLEAYAILTGMGPTYLWYQLSKLEELAVAFGLDSAAAREAIAAMVEGAAGTMVDSGLEGAEVMDLVPSKPMAPVEENMKDAYDRLLRDLYRKLTG